MSCVCLIGRMSSAFRVRGRESGIATPAVEELRPSSAVRVRVKLGVVEVVVIPIGVLESSAVTVPV